MRLDTGLLCSRRVVNSAAMFFALWGVGLATACFGPALPLLAAQARTSLDRVGLMFFGRSLGYLAGTLTSGHLFDRIRREGLLLGSSLCLTGVASCAIPFVPKLWMLVGLSFLEGISFGALDTGGSVCMLRLHGDRVAPWMQAMHFTYAVGTTVAPFLVGAFIERVNSITVPFVLMGVLTIACGVGLLCVPPFGDAQPKGSGQEGDKSTPMSMASVVSPEEPDDGITVAPQPSQSPAPAPQSPQQARLYWAVVAATAVSLFVYMTIESPFSSYLAAYALLKHLASETVAAFMVAVFFGSFCLGRLAGIPLSLLVDSERILMCCIGLCIVAQIPLVVFPNAVAVLWASSAAYGFCMGPIWGSLWTVLGKYIEVTGKAATFIVVGASVGDIIVPVAMGFLMVSRGAGVLAVQQLISCATEVLVFSLVLFLLHRHGPKTGSAAQQREVPQQATSEQ
eukprot:m51a1_g1871 putative sodium-dependent glucose transporter 1 (453) ;mRNA; r:663393-665335